MEKSKNNNEKYVVFDFDGTLADTLLISLKIFNSIAEEYGFEALNYDDIESIRTHSILGLMRRAKVPIWKIPKVVAYGQRTLKESISEVLPFEGIKEAVLNLKANGIRVGIITSNTSENVEKFLNLNDMKFFDFVYADASLWRKQTKIKKMMRNERIEPSQMIYVGDEVRDINGAHKAGVRVASVTWGFNNRETLENASPDFVFDKVGDLVKLKDLV